MARLISASIDLSKIDKSKIKNHENGGQYYDFTISVDDKPNQWGKDVSIFDSQTKEEREAKTSKKFLGSGKTFWSKEPNKERF